MARRGGASRAEVDVLRDLRGRLRVGRPPFLLWHPYSPAFVSLHSLVDGAARQVQRKYARDIRRLALYTAYAAVYIVLLLLQNALMFRNGAGFQVCAWRPRVHVCPPILRSETLPPCSARRIIRLPLPFRNRT